MAWLGQSSPVRSSTGGAAMRDPSRVRVPGPLEPYAEDFRSQLAERGYSPDAAAVQLQLMGHLSGWLAGRGLDATGLTAAVVDAYLAERRSSGCASHWTRLASAPPPAPAEVTPGPVAGPVEALLCRYARWLAAERGLAETTIRRNVELVRPLLRVGSGPAGLRWSTCAPLTSSRSLSPVVTTRVVGRRRGW